MNYVIFESDVCKISKDCRKFPRIIENFQVALLLCYSTFYSPGQGARWTPHSGVLMKGGDPVRQGGVCWTPRRAGWRGR